MGLTTKSLRVIGNRGRRKLDALFDAGSSFSLIRQDIAESISDSGELSEPGTFEAAVGRFRASSWSFPR